MQIYLRPNAKINLGLIIKGKREDGYHLLETVMYPVHQICDDLILEECSGSKPILELGGIEIDGDTESNLCVRAWHALKRRVPSLPPVRISLMKNIPIGAGLGGGSSDAAFTLLGLDELFHLGLDKSILAEAAAELGADVPFFIYNMPILAYGIGQDFAKVRPLPAFDVEIVTSPIHSSTVEVYKALDHTNFNTHQQLLRIIARPIEEWRDSLHNDLEKPVFEMYPELKETKESLYRDGAIYASMSGSGSAVFGLFLPEND